MPPEPDAGRSPGHGPPSPAELRVVEAQLAGGVEFAVPLGGIDHGWKRSTFTALGERTDGRLRVVIEAQTWVGPLRTRIEFTAIPPESHAVLADVLDTLDHPPVPPRTSDTIARWGEGLAAGVFFAGAGGWFGFVLGCMGATLTGTFDLLLSVVGGEGRLLTLGACAFGLFAAGLATGGIARSVVGRVFHEPAGAAWLRMSHGVPGPVRVLGRSNLTFYGRTRSMDVSALVALNRRYFALLEGYGALGWSALPLPAAAAAPLREALARAEAAGALAAAPAPPR